MQKILILLSCLVAAAAAQQHFYCDRDSPTTVSSSLTDFYVTTRRPSEASYSSDLSCEFRAESPSRAFFVDVTSFKVGSAVVTISSGDQVLFSGSSIPSFQTSMMTPSKSLKIRFDASGDRSGREGVTVRVRALDINGCPPGWTYLYGTCFGSGSTTFLTYVDAQRACNSMRSNLLRIPYSHVGSISSFMRMLPSNLKNYYTWIGLTDRSSRYQHYWLDGSRQSSTSEISCVSGGSAYSCQSSERCGAFLDRTVSKSIYMDDCSDRNRYACSAPPGGTSNFYTVPNSFDIYYYGTSRSWVWGVVVAVLFVSGLIIVGIYAGVRSSRARAQRMAHGATSVVVSTGQVTIPPPSSYPSQPQYPAPQAYPRAPQYPQYSTVPPSYESVAAGGNGQVNSAYAK